MAGKGFAPQPAPKKSSKASQSSVPTYAEVLADRLDAMGQDYYALTMEELREMRQVLTPTEVDLLIHFKTLNPRGEGSQTFEVQELAKQWRIDHSTVYRVLKRLHELQYLNVEILNGKGVVSILK